jgi:nitrogen fixation NifU-like protein
LGFVFGAQEKDYISDTVNLVKKAFGINPAPLCKPPGALHISFYSARLARYFAENFGKGAGEKRLPHWMMVLPARKQANILCGMFRGDGSIDNKRQRAKYITISRQLAYQLRLLLLRQNIISNFSEGKAYGIHKKSYLLYIQEDESLRRISQIMGKKANIIPKTQLRHKSWFDTKFFYTTVRQNRAINYKGQVCNLEVEGSHSYVSSALTLHNCGDVMKMFLKIENDIIVDVKFKTFGCGAAVATSSMVTEMVKGKTIEEALKISNKAVAEALGGLPPVKMHCSVLAEEALRSALKDYYIKQGKPVPFEDKGHTHENEKCL